MDFLKEKNLLEEGISDDTKLNFSGLAQWININAIIGFVSITVSLLAIIIGIGNNSGYGFGNNAIIGASAFGNFIGIALSLLLTITLFKSAKNLKLGLDTTNQSNFNTGLAKLASYFKIVGILAIVALVIMVAALLIGVLVGASGGFK